MMKNLHKKINSKFRQEKWMSVINVVDANIAYDNPTRLLVTYYEECCPVQEVYLKDKIDNPWMTTSFKNACKKKKYLYIKFL